MEILDEQLPPRQGKTNPRSQETSFKVPIQEINAQGNGSQKRTAFLCYVQYRLISNQEVLATT